MENDRMKLYLNFNPFAKVGSGTWEDFSEALMDTGFSRRSCYGSRGKAEIQTVSMTLMPVANLQSLLVRILVSTNDIRAKLTRDDGSPYFIGTIRPMVSATVKDRAKPFTVEILDDSYFLESYVFQEASTLSSNLKVVNSNPSDSLVHWLILNSRIRTEDGQYICPFASYDIMIGSDVDQTIDADGLTLNTGDYIDEILEAVCYEYNLQYRFTEEGKILIERSIPMDTTGAVAILDHDIKNTLTVRRSDDSNQGVVVTYYPVIKGPCKVARHNIMDTRWADDKTFGRGYEWLNPDEVIYPPLSYQDVTLSPFDLDNPGRQILRYDKGTLVPRVTYHEDTKDSRQSRAKVADNGDGSYKLWIDVAKRKTLVQDLYLMCQCWYIDKDDERTTQVHQGKDPEKYEAKYIHTGVTANALLKAIALRNLTGNTTYSFQALPSLGLVPGEIRLINSSAYGVLDYVRIRSVIDHGDSKATGLCEVEAESVTALADLQISTDEQVVSYLASLGSNMLKVDPPTTTMTHDDEAFVEITASGDAITKLGATLSWYVNGIQIPWSEETIVISHQAMVVGDNVIRVEAIVPGIDFGDKPLEAECVVSIQSGAISILVDSLNGDKFRPGTISTTLVAQVLRGDKDITDELPETAFSWERTSDNPAGDISWNTSSKAIGHKSVNLTPDDVSGRTVFTCHVYL
jgi:hypothetical protein